MGLSLLLVGGGLALWLGAQASRAQRAEDAWMCPTCPILASESHSRHATGPPVASKRHDDAR
jgi:hypothetical protein